MALYQVSDMVPSLNSTIDGFVINNFQFKIRGSNCNGYNLTIYTVTNNQQVYTVNKTEKENDGDVISVPIPANILINGTVYKWVVGVTSNGIDYINSYEVQFNVYSSPRISISNYSPEINNSSYTFKALYYQPEGIDIYKYQWFLYDAWDNLLSQSDEIESTNIEYAVSGLISDYSYKIKVVGVSQLGVECESDLYTFVAKYDTTSSKLSLTATANTNRNSIDITWPKIRQINETINGNTCLANFNDNNNYMYSAGIAANSNVLWNSNVEIPTTYTVISKTKIIEDGQKIEIADQYSNKKYLISYSNGVFTYTIDSNTYHINKTVDYNTSIILAMRPMPLGLYVHQLSTSPTDVGNIDGGNSNSTFSRTIGGGLSYDTFDSMVDGLNAVGLQ